MMTFWVKVVKLKKLRQQNNHEIYMVLRSVPFGALFLWENRVSCGFCEIVVLC